jgi:hypothetical protein
VEFVEDKVALGQVFSEYFGFRCQSRAIDQAVSGWLPTAAALVQTRF